MCRANQLGRSFTYFQWVTTASCLLIALLAPSVLSQEGKELSQTDQVPTAETRTKIDGLIQQLGAEKYRDRKRAETELQEMGMVVIEPLQSVRSDADTEIRLRSRRLIELMRKRYITEGLPPEIKSALKGYDEQPLAKRREILVRVAKIDTAMTSGAIARIARVEETEEISKLAALAILRSENAAATEQNRKRQLICIGFSERSACNWIRTFVKSHDTPDQALKELKQMLSDEQQLLDAGSSNTSRDIVEQLSLRLIDCLVRAQREPEAYAEMKQLALASTGPTTTLNSVDWLIDKKAWATIDELAKAGSEKFAKDALLLYRLAEASHLAGNAEATKNLSDQAFDAAGGGIDNYIGLYQSHMVNLVLQVSRSSDPDRRRRYSLAMLLQEERGLYDWAEREYREATETDDPLLLHDAAGHLSEMLHDLQRDGEGAEVRKKAIKAVDPKKKGFDNILGPEFVSRMHYLRGCQANLDGKSDEAIKHFQAALQAEPNDIESLIGLYNTENLPPDVKKEAVNQIEQVAEQYHSKVRSYRLATAQNKRSITSSNLTLALNENQYAWLVCNTEGDVDEAIKCSEHSLKVKPNDFGYLDTLAHCYYKKGDYAKAVQLQAEAARLAPNLKEIHRKLAKFEQALASPPESSTDGDEDPVEDDDTDADDDSVDDAKEE